MEHKLRIALDVDGVLRDVVYTACEIYNREMKPEKPIFPEHIKHYNLVDLVGIEDPVDWTFNTHAREVLEGSPMIWGTIKALERLKGLCEITIITKQPTPYAKLATLKWLKNNGILDLVDSVQFTHHNKRFALDGYDIIVDDWEENFRDIDFKLGVLIRTPYNESFHADDIVDADNPFPAIRKWDSFNQFSHWLVEVVGIDTVRAVFGYI